MEGEIRLANRPMKTVQRTLTRRKTALLLMGPAYFLVVAIAGIVSRQCAWPSCEHSANIANYALSFLPAVAIVWVALIYLGVRCPYCHRTAFKIEGNLAGLPFYSLAVGEECQHCGESFRMPKSSTR